MSTARLSFPYLAGGEFSLSRRILHHLSAHDLAMDLGTANTLIYMKHYGIVLNEPSIVAVEEESGQVIAVGHRAKEMFGKTSRAIRCVRPMKDGVIADFEQTSLMISYMIRKVQGRRAWRAPRIVIGVPSGITQVEKRAVIDAALASGVRKVFLVEEPMAAALGVGLPVDRPVGNMIVDIGGGTTEVAIISLGGTVYSHSIRVAGDEMDEAIQRHLRRTIGLDVGIFEAERVKLIIGSLLPSATPRAMRVFGRELTSGFPKSVEVSEDLVREALEEPISAITSSVVTAIEQTSAEAAQDIMARGIYLAGGGSLLRGLSERLQRETGMRFYRAPDPLSCVVRGVGKVVENLKELNGLCIA